MINEIETLATFEAWVQAFQAEVPMEDALRHGQYFIANHIAAPTVGTRGAVYDFFADMCTYYRMRSRLYAGSMNPQESQTIHNAATLAKGIVWAVQHDGFDLIKYEPLASWGMDIQSAVGK